MGGFMSNAAELLRRALDAWDRPASDKFSVIFEDIRAYLASEKEAEPTKVEMEFESEDFDWESKEGAVVLFAGWLTTRDKVISCGATENASPMAEAIKEYKTEWPERFTKPDQNPSESIKNQEVDRTRKPMTDEAIEIATGTWQGPDYADGFEAGIRFAEKHHFGMGGSDE